MKDRIIILFGGIGAGKSVVSRVLRLCGLKVYDCDSEAKRLMDKSPVFLNKLADTLGEEYLFPDGSLNRRRLAERVFSDKEALDWLNGEVHQMVREDILKNANDGIFFIESAIPVVSGLLDIADEVWLIDAPEDQRVLRAAERSNLPAETIYARVRAQQCEMSGVLESGLPVTVIDNSENAPVLDEILSKIHLLERNN